MTLEILKNIGIAFLAIFIITLFKSRGAIASGEFKPTVFFQENIYRWIWVMLMVTAIAVLNTYSPESLTPVTSFVGIELSTSPGAFATLGVLLLTTIKGGLSTKRKKARIAKREQKINS